MKRTKDYRRSVAKTHIAKKKGISENVYHFDWYKNDNQYSKNKVHCSCWMCSKKDAYYDWLRLHCENNKFRENLEEAGVDYNIPNRDKRTKKYGRNYSHYSNHWG